MLVGCKGGGIAAGSAQQVTQGPTEAQQKAMSPDQVAAANNKGTATYSAPPASAGQGAAYRIAPANPNDPHFKPDPRLAGGH